MDDVDLVGDVFQLERPVYGRVTAARDDHTAAAEILAAADVVLDSAAGFIGLQAVQRWAVGTEGAGAGGDQHGTGVDFVALIRAEHESAGLAVHGFHAASEKTGWREGSDLRFELRDQRAGFDGGVGRDVVDGFFGVEGRALATHLVQRVDQHAGEFQHAAFEGGEQAHRPGADNGYIGLDHVAVIYKMRGMTQGEAPAWIRRR